MFSLKKMIQLYIVSLLAEMFCILLCLKNALLKDHSRLQIFFIVILTPIQKKMSTFGRHNEFVYSNFFTKSLCKNHIVMPNLQMRKRKLKQKYQPPPQQSQKIGLSTVSWVSNPYVSDSKFHTSLFCWHYGRSYLSYCEKLKLRPDFSCFNITQTSLSFRDDVT